MAQKKKASSPSREEQKRPHKKSEAQPRNPAKGQSSDQISGEPEVTIAKESPDEGEFPIAGIGGSAGGLEALTQLLESLPYDTGIAFVVVQHLDPNHESILTELLARATRMPVSQVSDGMLVEPNHVYVIPPNANMGLVNGHLRLIPRKIGHGIHMPIDYFFRSLAEQRKTNAIGVILSGNASDGALGLQAIKAEGGITFVQSEETAKYRGMPSSAIAASPIDFILPPSGIAKELARIGRHPFVSLPIPPETEAPASAEDEFEKIFAMLRVATGVDFSHYKYTTLKRRILRRMALHRIESLSDYLKHLNENRQEVEALYQELLIKVTSFFRDPEAFEALKKQVFPRIVDERTDHEPIRIWIPGCASGEEAYSIAISLLEYLSETSRTAQIQIFATDISEAALEKARSGIYIENIALDVSPERLRRFFIRVDGKYQINKSVREMCIFARQNVFQDPPFSKLDLISCRNVLIYLGVVLQRKVIPIFHYALNPGGHLFLGSSETIGQFGELFTLVDKKHKIYSKRHTATRLQLEFGEADYLMDRKTKGRREHEEQPAGIDIQKEADRMILARYAPAGVLVNSEMEIVQFRGSTSPFLEPSPGKASLNVLKMAREGLLLELRAAIHQAKKEDRPVRKEGLQVKYADRYIEVSIEVIPLSSPAAKDCHFLIMFEEIPEAGAKAGKDRRKPEKPKAKPDKVIPAAQHVEKLQQELAATREYMQSLIEDQEASNEELRSANEEILSSNEEMQSTNEELETAKEELQSSNEELTTVNEELQNRNTELHKLNNDFSNLFNSVNLPILILGSDLRIRRMTQVAEKVLNLIPSDIGRPVGDINLRLNLPNLQQLIIEVIETVAVKEMEVQDLDGHWHLLRLRPYRTTENKIDGCLLFLIDIHEMKQAFERLAALQGFSEAVIDTVRHPFVVLNADLRVQKANRAFYQAFGLQPDYVVGRPLLDLGNGEWKMPDLNVHLERVQSENAELRDLEVNMEMPGAGMRVMLMNVGRINQTYAGMPNILLSMEDITVSKRKTADLESRLEQRDAKMEEARRLLEPSYQSIAVLLTSPVRVIDGFSHWLMEEYGDKLDEKGKDYLERVRAATQNLARVLGRLQEMATLSHAQPRFEAVDLGEMARAIARQLHSRQPERQVEFRIAADGLLVQGDPQLLNKALENLLDNAWKFSRRRENALVEFGALHMDGEKVYYVKDNGAGFDPAFTNKLFGIMQRLHHTEEFEGIGLGLTMVQRIIDLHGGRVWGEGKENEGATFYFALPEGNRAGSEE